MPSFKIDLHAHCQEHSPCSKSPASSIVEAAIARGLDALAFTNHNSFMEPSLLKGLRSSYPALKIYNCIEISVGQEHFLYVGPFDAQLQAWSSGYEALWRKARENGAFLALAHPFRFSDIVDAPIDEFPPDAVEIHSTNTGKDDAKAIAKLAASLGAKLLTNSDGHAPESIGAYCNQLEAAALPEDEAGLAACLKAARMSQLEDNAIIQRHNQWVGKLEKLAKRLIAAGKSPEEFEAVSGAWRGYYDRVKMGRSYKI